VSPLHQIASIDEAGNVRTSAAASALRRENLPLATVVQAMRDRRHASFRRNLRAKRRKPRNIMDRVS
jgi:hypothetical protein